MKGRLEERGRSARLKDCEESEKEKERFFLSQKGPGRTPGQIGSSRQAGELQRAEDVPVSASGGIKGDVGRRCLVSVLPVGL
ncbi:MAG: hypothetical protein ACRERD_27450 [Candidatus Binatia bacterium]